MFLVPEKRVAAIGALFVISAISIWRLVVYKKKKESAKEEKISPIENTVELD
jgi:hypothetical protein